MISSGISEENLLRFLEIFFKKMLRKMSRGIPEVISGRFSQESLKKCDELQAAYAMHAKFPKRILFEASGRTKRIYSDIIS